MRAHSQRPSKRMTLIFEGHSRARQVHIDGNDLPSSARHDAVEAHDSR